MAIVSKKTSLTNYKFEVNIAHMIDLNQIKKRCKRGYLKFSQELIAVATNVNQMPSLQQY